MAKTVTGSSGTTWGSYASNDGQPVVFTADVNGAGTKGTQTGHSK